MGAEDNEAPDEISGQEIADLAGELVTMIGERWRGRATKATAGLVVVQLVSILLVEITRASLGEQLRAVHVAREMRKNADVHNMERAAKA